MFEKTVSRILVVMAVQLFVFYQEASVQFVFNATYEQISIHTPMAPVKEET